MRSALVRWDDRPLLMEEVKRCEPLPNGARVRVVKVILRDELPLVGRFGAVISPHLNPKYREFLVLLDGDSTTRPFVQYELELIDRLDYTTVDEGGVV